jgi:hypothetical protein
LEQVEQVEQVEEKQNHHFNNMETFDPLSIVREGTESHAVALQVAELAKQARALGLDEQANAMTKALYFSIKNKNELGFKAAKSLALGVMESVKAEGEQNQKVNESASRIKSILGFAKDSQMQIDPALISSAAKMEKDGNIAGLDELAGLLKGNITRQAEAQTKLQEAQAKGTMSSTAQIEANKIMAEQLLGQFHNAQRILNDPENYKAFTGNPFEQKANELRGIGNNVKSYYNSISGYNLAKGMSDIKETTGTAAGMSEGETRAFQKAQSALDINQDWSNAAEALNIFNSTIIRSLKNLGVRNQYLTPQGAQDWLLNTDVNLPLLDSEEIPPQPVAPPTSTPVVPTSTTGTPTTQSSSGSAPTFGGQSAAFPTTPLPSAPAQPAPQAPATPTPTPMPTQPVAPDTTQTATPVNPYATIRSKMRQNYGAFDLENQ